MEGQKIARLEWPTMLLLASCYAGWLALTALYQQIGGWLFVALVAPVITLHSSLQHEALHGHPTRSARLNELLVFLPLGLLFPYRRFKTLHLRHHSDSALTDPYDDPESFYYALADWQGLPASLQRILDFNNTLLGRFTIGPIVMLVGLLGSDLRLIAGGDREVRQAWLMHLAGVAAIVIWTAMLRIPTEVYFAAAYLGLSILSLRTFAEHQAHEKSGGRTVIIETSPIFGLLFLNNNLHYVHHENPRVPWYRLPALYRANKAAFLAANEGYTFKGYSEMVARYLFKAKAPVPHPFLRRN